MLLLLLVTAAAASWAWWTTPSGFQVASATVSGAPGHIELRDVRFYIENSNIMREIDKHCTGCRLSEGPIFYFRLGHLYKMWQDPESLYVRTIGGDLQVFPVGSDACWECIVELFR